MATVIVTQRMRKNHGKSYDVSYLNPRNGKKKHFRSFRLKREASAAAAELRVLIDSGSLPEKVVKHVPMTIQDVASRLESDYYRKVKIGELSSKTLEGYLVFLHRVVVDLGAEFMARIDTVTVLEYQARLAEKGSNVLSNRVMFLLKQLCKLAFKLGALESDPCVGVRYLSEKQHQRNRYLQPDELSKLIQAARLTKAKHYLPLLILLAAEHGASRQECLSLKWKDIRHHSGCASIRFFRTKNGMERTLSLMPLSYQELAHWREHLMKGGGRNPDVESPVFTRLDGRPIASFRKAFSRACQLAKIVDFHFHDLRHTYCSNLILSGAQLKDVKEMIGHSDIAMTDRYSHLSSAHMVGLQERLAERYAQGAQPGMPAENKI